MNRQVFLSSVIIIGLFLDVYVFFAFKKAFDSKLVPFIYWGFHIAYYIIFIYGMFYGKNEDFWRQFTLISLTLLYIPKIFIAFFLFIEDVTRIFSSLYSSIKGESVSIPSRRKFISQLAIGLASIPFLGVLHGVTFGKYNFRVIRKTLYFDDLPSEFDGFTITQISDVHSGSFEDDKQKIEYAIDLINEQQSDLFLFTGDLVNNVASEMAPWIDTFKKIKAPYGKMSVMGNHDYGMYGRFSENKEEHNRLKKQNLKDFYELHEKIGFDLLRNENRQIEKNGQKINIIGVENWGASPYFPKKGNLQVATENIKDNEFNVLMSHDPSHFDFKVAQYRSEEDRKKAHEEKPIIAFEKKMHLTLSGHTHGAQMGIEIPGFKWSPVKYFYSKWAGLYEEAGRYLYVNRGFGFLGFPGRIGIWPEITVFELKKEKAS